MNQHWIQSPRRRHVQGFTLIELLVAIAILGILGTVTLRYVFKHVDEAKQTTTLTKLKEVHAQVQIYRRKHNELPQDLQVLLEADTMNNGDPYLSDEDIIDAWDNPMVIKAGDRTGEFEIISYGANRTVDDFDASLGFDRDLSSVRPLNDPNANR